MNKIVIVLSAFILLASACKTIKQPAQSEYTSDPTTETKVFTVPGTSTETASKVEPAAAPAPVMDAKPIAVRKEQVSFTDQNEQTANAGNTFFVIIGSFGQLDNAKNYRATLLDEGFTPIILHSETGYYRVCVNSFKSEGEARGKVAQIRQSFPKYSDVWLLVKE